MANDKPMVLLLGAILVIWNANASTVTAPSERQRGRLRAFWYLLALRSSFAIRVAYTRSV